MKPEQKRTKEKVDKEYEKASAALDAVPTLEASTRKRSLAARYAIVRNAVAESERADATFRDAKGDRKEAMEKLSTITIASVAILTAADADKLLPPAVTDGSASAPETAEYLLKNLATVPEGGLLTRALQNTVDQAEAAGGGAEAKQIEAERFVYVAFSEFFKELHDTLGYIKTNTEEDSAARKKLKQKRTKRRTSDQADEEPGEGESTEAEVKAADSKPAEPKSDDGKVA